MSNEDEYASVADRQKAGKPRVHSGLTKSARDRLFPVISNPGRISPANLNEAIPDTVIEQALNTTAEDVGYSEIQQYTHELKTPFAEQRKLIEDAKTETVLAFIENLFEEVLNTNPLMWDDVPVDVHNKSSYQVVVDRIPETVEKINTILETECILWKLETENDEFNFRPIGSELMEESVENFISISQSKKWKSVSSPYNAAHELYSERKYSREIPEKLYNSIEELARTICVDLEGWEDNREQNLSIYLETMRANNIFEPNNIMKAELDDLTRSMEKAFQKAGAERHNRHSEIDREYATLLLHQVSAYLTYIIKQYEENHS